MRLAARTEPQPARIDPCRRARRKARPICKASPSALVAGAALALCLIAVGCSPTPRPSDDDGAVYRTSDFDELAGWRADRHSEALPAMRRSCAALARLPADRPLGGGALAGRAGDWREPCRALEAKPVLDDMAARAYFERWFRPVRVSAGGDADGLFTAYFEPELRGSRRRGGRYQVPLYGRPADLVETGDRKIGRMVGGRFQPYPARAAIDAGAVRPAPPVLFWVDDPVDAYVLHVQGSGRIRLAEGGVARVGVAATNGRTYVSIGRLMVERGLLGREHASMQNIRAWLHANPAAGRKLMEENPRYVFFREIAGEGPVGAQGVPLTALRSLAIDPAYVPLGAPIWLDTSWPGRPEKPFRRLMVAQDTGGAIKGAVRGDVFWGAGEAALADAGRMSQRGRYYVLVPRSAAERVAAR